jgi:serine/threonine protein kinase
VHTDIKATNICVKFPPTEGLPFEVVFIDWDEAFSISTPSTTGNGTPGYMAPEFFKRLEDYKQQLENRAISINVYCSTLKSNYKDLFSEASDVYALGIVLLKDLHLEPSSPLYHLAQAMCHNTPSRRPSGECIHKALEDAALTDLYPCNLKGLDL